VFFRYRDYPLFWSNILNMKIK